MITESIPNKSRIRIAVTLVYFSMGLGFSSWASRIPEIKTALHLNDAIFGTILFALPVGQFLMMPFSGKLVTHFGSHKVGDAWYLCDCHGKTQNHPRFWWVSPAPV